MLDKGKLNMDWIPISGKWKFEDDTITYLSPQDPQLPFGIALCSKTSRNGNLETNILLTEAKDSSGRIIFGYNAGNYSYFSAGLGGYKYAFLIDEYADGRGWQGLSLKSTQDNLENNRPYKVNVNVFGQNIILNFLTIIQKF